ncbi:MAG: hypothetical protein QM607_01220 [Microbacterium sp.]
MTIRSLHDERGSIMPLVIGYVALGLALAIVALNATSLYLAQRGLDQVADAAAVAGADGFTIGWDGPDPVARLDDAAVWAQAQTVAEASGAQLVAASTPDGTTSRVTVATTWHPLVVSAFVPSGVSLTSTSTSRTALR